MAEPLLKDYRVGLVVPSAGVNEAQLAEIKHRLRSVAALLPEGSAVRVVVFGFDEEDERSGLQPEVLNLGHIHKVQVGVIAFDPRRGSSAVKIVRHCEFALPCDEVWCCPETPNRKARPNQVYAYGQRGNHPQMFKMIPPWVEAPAPNEPAKAKPKKERRPW